MSCCPPGLLTSSLNLNDAGDDGRAKASAAMRSDALGGLVGYSTSAEACVLKSLEVSRFKTS